MLRLVLNFGTKTNQKSQSATQTQYQKFRAKPNQTAIFWQNPKPNAWIFQSMKYSQNDRKLYIVFEDKVLRNIDSYLVKSVLYWIFIFFEKKFAKFSTNGYLVVSKLLGLDLHKFATIYFVYH
jgi:hypothetical protein